MYQVQSEVEEVKSLMHDNIQKTLQNLDKVETLQDKTGLYHLDKNGPIRDRENEGNIQIV